MNDNEDDSLFCVYINHHTDSDEKWICERKLYVT